MFSEEPVPLDVFLYDSAYLGLRRQGIELSPIQLDFIRHFEQVLDMETYALLMEELGSAWEPVRMCHTIVGAYGKGSGKDLLCRLSFARIANLLLSLNSPQQYFGIPETDEIQMLNVAVSAPQARRAFFKPLRNLLVTSPWFQDKFRGDHPSELANDIRLKKNIELISGHSQAESLEGLNLIAAVADEVGAFKTESEVSNSAGRVNSQTAEYIINMLRSSAATRFPNNFKLGIISYPRFEGDALMTAVERGRKDNEKYGEKSTHFVSGPYATWDVNPRVSRNSPEIVKDYEDDPEYAAAKYECKPPKASDRFIRSDMVIENAFRRDEDPAVEVEYYWGLPKHQENVHMPQTKEGWQVKFTFAPGFFPMQGAVYALHGDIAIKNDRAGIAMSHISQYRTAPFQREQEDLQPVVRVDFVTAFEADLGARRPDGEHEPREVKIAWYRQLIFELIARGFDVGKVTFDGWQSVDIIQQLEEFEIESGVLSLDRTTKVYDEFKSIIYDDRLDGPYHELAIEEFKKLSKVTGNKIDHPPNGSKDLADAIAGSVFNAITLGGTEGEDPQEVDLGWYNYAGADTMYTEYNIQLEQMDYRMVGVDHADFRI